MDSRTSRFTVILTIYAILQSNKFIECALQSDESTNKSSMKPNIIIILADDMGFSDVSIHGSNQIPTPNIDALGIMGIQLNQMYVGPMCTPSRSALMTGKYPSNLGMQHYVIIRDQPYGLDPQEKTMADYMKQGGYGTYLIGKWHLGSHEKQYTPLFRGFDSHFGYLGGSIDYYDYTHKTSTQLCGYDMRNNLTVYKDSVGKYATDLFTEKAVETIENHNKSTPMFMMLTHLAPHTGNEYDPMQAPEEEVNKFNYINDKGRRTYAAMVSKLDESVGKVIEALGKNRMIDNSIILFMPDNGSPIEGLHANYGSNYPFKGQKNSPWEGAVRSAAAIWSPLLFRRQRISNQLIHISDWLPTFAKIAGVNIEGNIDGKNVWPALSYNMPSLRNEILVHHDETTPCMAYIRNNFKLVSGSTYDGLYDRWLSPPINPSEVIETFGEQYADAILSSRAGQALLLYTATKENHVISRDEINEIQSSAQITCNGYTPHRENSSKACKATASPCLFNIVNDPCETNNVASEYPEIVIQLQDLLDYYGSIAKPIRNQPSDPRSDPANFGGIWTWWLMS